MPGVHNLATTKREPGAGRAMEPVAEMEAPTQSAQKELLHDTIFSTVNLVPHQENKFTAKAMTSVHITAHFHSKRIIFQMLTIQVLVLR